MLMKYWAKNAFRWWRVIASICLTAVPAIAFSQGRPNIVWFSGSHGNSVNSLAHSPDGQLLISGSSDRTIKLWRRDGTFIKTLSVPYDPNGQLNDVRSVAISPGGKLLAKVLLSIRMACDVHERMIPKRVSNCQ